MICERCELKIRRYSMTARIVILGSMFFAFFVADSVMRYVTRPAPKEQSLANWIVRSSTYPASTANWGTIEALCKLPSELPKQQPGESPALYNYRINRYLDSLFHGPCTKDSPGAILPKAGQ
jgi:hypothetical protein